jgi:signal transduction histidine kinase
MPWELTTLSALGFVAAGVHAVLVVVGWRYRDSRCGIEIAALHFVVGLSALSYSVLLGFDSVAAQRQWWQLTFALSSAVPMLWLLLVVQYVSRSQWLTRTRAALLALEPVVVILATLTNGFTHLVWRVPAESVAANGALPVSFGPLYYAHIVVAYTAVVVGMGLIILVGIRMSLLYWKQVAVLAIAPLPPFVSHMAFLLGVSPVPGVNLTVFAFTITGALLVAGLYHYDLLERMPVARRRAFEAMGDGLIVLDSDRVVVDADETASRVLDPPPEAGTPVSELFPEQGFEQLHETTVTDANNLAYDVRVSDLTDTRGDEVGYALALRDVTGRHRYEQRLEVANRILRHNLRNDMNVVRGYADVVAGGSADDVEQAAASILDRTDDLLTVSDKARKVSQLNDTHTQSPATHDVSEIVASTVRSARRAYPAVGFTCRGQEHARAELTDATAITTAIEELTDLLVAEAEVAREDLALSISVTSDSPTGTVTVRIESNGPDIPAVDREALDAGSETPLQHAEGLGLWLAYWCVIENGGSLRFDDEEVSSDDDVSPASGAGDDGRSLDTPRSLRTVAVIQLPGSATE